MTELKKANQFISTNKENINPVFRNHYHLMGPIGWINDPNGFVYFRGEYHLFYQFYPYDSVWGPMHWGHAKSKDLINWEQLPVALAPSESYDIDGCFSGTALVENDKLYLFYTGHVENEQIKREVQCMAVSEDGIHFEKYLKNPLVDETHITNIASYEDFRDPKVFKKDDDYFMLVASQTEDSRGQILMFKSEDMLNWSFNSILLEGDTKQGIMWECPDLFQIDGKDILIMSPIQMPSVGNKYANRSSTVAFIGEVDWQTGKFLVENYHEIDGGLDFYAPQTCFNDLGEIFLVAWMQMWDRNMPTNDLKHGWAGSMTLPRKLSLKNNRLKQEPIEIPQKQIQERSKRVNFLLKEQSVKEKISQRNRITISIDFMEASKVSLYYGKKEETFFEISYDKHTSLLEINREKMGYSIKGAEKPTLTKRAIEVPLVENHLKLEIYGDTSSIELFTNDGQALSTTFFEEAFSGVLEIAGDDELLIKELTIEDIIVD